MPAAEAVPVLGSVFSGEVTSEGQENIAPDVCGPKKAEDETG